MYTYNQQGRGNGFSCDSPPMGKKPFVCIPPPKKQQLATPENASKPINKTDILLGAAVCQKHALCGDNCDSAKNTSIPLKMPAFSYKVKN